MTVAERDFDAICRRFLEAADRFAREPYNEQAMLDHYYAHREWQRADRARREARK